MPALECPLGTDCKKGPESSTWKTQDVDKELALSLLETHMKYAHQLDGASGSPAQQVMSPGDHNNVNKGVQGANFDNCAVNNPVINLHTPGGGSFRENYQKSKLIGRGSFGEAWIVKPKNVLDKKERFILKEITCFEETVETGKNEIAMLKNCRHERIVYYIEDFYENNKILIIMEYCEGGDLARFIESQKQFLDVDFIIAWVSQLTSGVRFIHRRKIIHRDLKPANIFLTVDKNLKIGDFGVAKCLDRTSGLASTFAGTAVYIAPEIHGGQKYDMSADLWSLGCIIFEIATLKKPFSGKDFLQAICKE